MEFEVKVPDLGNIPNAKILELFLHAGDIVSNPETPIFSIESDKAVIDVPISVVGVVEKILVSKGDLVSTGKVCAIVKIDNSNSSDKSEIALTASSQEKLVNTYDEKTTDVKQSASYTYAGPLTRKLAREFDINLNNVVGSGRNGRIVQSDIEAIMNSKTSPVFDAHKLHDNVLEQTQIQKLSRIKIITAKNLTKSVQEIPMVTQFADVDITETEKFRASQKESMLKANIKLTLLPFIIYSIVRALKKYPEFNSSLSEDFCNLIIKRYFNVGIAIDTNDGLVVPVLHNADRFSISEIAIWLTEISAKAYNGKLKPSDFSDGTFTISNLGGFGGGHFTPIIKQPEVGIIGISRSQDKPVYFGDSLVKRTMLPIALTYDHRVIDGALGAKFISEFSSLISDIRLTCL